MKFGEVLSEDIRVTRRHLMTHVGRQQRSEHCPREAMMMNGLRRTDYVVVRVKSDGGDVLRRARTGRGARRATRLRRSRRTVHDVDAEDKENICHSKQGDGGSKRRSSVLTSSAEFDANLPALSAQFDKFFADLSPPTGCASSRRFGRGGDGATASASSPLSRGVGRRGVPDAVEDPDVGNDTSVWSAAVSVNHSRRPTLATRPPGASDGSRGGCLDLSRICSASSDEHREFREQTSSGELTGAFHSTFSYPLHSTLLVSAANVDVSDVLETVDHVARDLAKTAPPVGPRLTNDVLRHCTDSGSSATGRHSDDVTSCRTGAPSQVGRQSQMPVTARLSSYNEAGERGTEKTSRRVMFFPPLPSTTVNAMTSAADSVNMSPERQDDDADSVSRTVRAV